jgi:hypothetical protein
MTEGRMRTWYVCLGCGAERLPPARMADVIDCGDTACAAQAVAVVAMSGLPPATVVAMARRAAGMNGERRNPKAARVRGRRAAAGPRTARSRLL